jgi:hypothetical protein
VACGFTVEHSRGGQLRRRVEQPGDDEPQRQVATALWRTAGQQVVEADAPGSAQSSEDMAMRQRPADLEAGLADWGQRITAQRGAQGLDTLERQLGEVGQRAVLDLAVLAIGLTQQERGAGVAVGDLGDVHEASDQTDSASVKGNPRSA